MSCLPRASPSPDAQKTQRECKTKKKKMSMQTKNMQDVLGVVHFLPSQSLSEPQGNERKTPGKHQKKNQSVTGCVHVVSSQSLCQPWTPQTQSKGKEDAKKTQRIGKENARGHRAQRKRKAGMKNRQQNAKRNDQTISNLRPHVLVIL